MDIVAAKVGGRRESVSEHPIQPGCGECAGRRGMGRSNLPRENILSGANGNREESYFSSFS